MYRNLDLVSLRTLVAIAETGGMTSAANVMHLTQSAVSMQIKRLEEQLSSKLLVREGRKVSPTKEGVQLITYARRMIELNDEAMKLMVQPAHDVTIKLGVPFDLVYPSIPKILHQVNQDYPSYRLDLTSGLTYDLQQGMRDGKHDIILTTEKTPAAGGKLIARQPLVWSTAIGGVCWRRTPIPLAFSPRCKFLEPAIAALDKAGLPWTHAVHTYNEDNAYVVAIADLGVRAEMASTELTGAAPIDHRGELPPLPEYSIVMYCSESIDKTIGENISAVIEEVFSTIAT